mgnify:CR=1 FL=1
MKHEILNSKQFQNYKFKYSKSRFQFLSFDIRICFEFRCLNFEFVKKNDGLSLCNFLAKLDFSAMNF